MSKAKTRGDGNWKQLRFTILGLVQKNEYLDGWFFWNINEKMMKIEKIKMINECGKFFLS